jgi:hypothetical protein
VGSSMPISRITRIIASWSFASVMCANAALLSRDSKSFATACSTASGNDASMDSARGYGVEQDRRLRSLT